MRATHIQSMPIKVLFAGFESNTLQLQNSGWQISIEQEMSHRTYGYDLRLAMKHEKCALLALSNTITLSGRELSHSIRCDRNYYATPAVLTDPDFFFEIIYVSPKIDCMIVPMQTASFNAVDARPQIIEHDKVDLEQIAMFKPVNVSEDFEIYLNKKDEADILKLLLEKQDPKQKEIRENRRKRAWRDVRDSSSEVKEGYDPYLDIKGQLVLVS